MHDDHLIRQRRRGMFVIREDGSHGATKEQSKSMTYGHSRMSEAQKERESKTGVKERAIGTFKSQSAEVQRKF